MEGLTTEEAVVHGSGVHLATAVGSWIQAGCGRIQESSPHSSWHRPRAVCADLAEGEQSSESTQLKCTWRRRSVCRGEDTGLTHEGNRSETAHGIQGRGHTQLPISSLSPYTAQGPNRTHWAGGLLTAINLNKIITGMARG